MDVLGDEQPGYGIRADEDGKYPSLWLWTRSESGAQGRGGSPYVPAAAGSGYQFDTFNANGCDDAVVITLSSGP